VSGGPERHYKPRITQKVRAHNDVTDARIMHLNGSFPAEECTERDMDVFLTISVWPTTRGVVALNRLEHRNNSHERKYLMLFFSPLAAGCTSSRGVLEYIFHVSVGYIHGYKRRYASSGQTATAVAAMSAHATTATRHNDDSRALSS